MKQEGFVKPDKNILSIEKNKIRKENTNDKTDIIFTYPTCNNHSISLLGQKKR